MPVRPLIIQCKHCHAEDHFKLGHDDKEDSIEKAIDNFQGKTQIQLRSIIRKHQVNSAEYGYALFNCPDCHTLFNPYAVEIEYDDIMLFKPFHKCGTCNSTLMRANEKFIDSYSCRQCGEKQLREKQ